MLWGERRDASFSALERLSNVAAAQSRRSRRLADVQRHIGMALGGAAGARLARRLALPVSGYTLLRVAVPHLASLRRGARSTPDRTASRTPLRCGDRSPRRTIMSRLEAEVPCRRWHLRWRLTRLRARDSASASLCSSLSPGQTGHRSPGRGSSLIRVAVHSIGPAWDVTSRARAERAGSNLNKS
jgi:hypothetical protein